jgi:hypothetical protein
MTDTAVIHVSVKTILIPPGRYPTPRAGRVNVGASKYWNIHTRYDDRAGAKHSVTLGDAAWRHSYSTRRCSVGKRFGSGYFTTGPANWLPTVVKDWQRLEMYRVWRVLKYGTFCSLHSGVRQMVSWLLSLPPTNPYRSLDWSKFRKT